MKVDFIANISLNQSSEMMIDSSFSGFELCIDFDKIKNLFGKFSRGDPWKTKAEWILLFSISNEENQTKKFIPICIYDYNVGKILRKNIKNWHIGCHKKDIEDVILIIEWIKEKTK